MFSETARYYDLIYSRLKDYPVESAKIAALIRTVNPRATRILDVACGTAEHARYLEQQHGFSVDALDKDPAFVEIARSKLHSGEVYLEDMVSFDLPNRYDAVLCLFSSIAYAKSLDNVAQTLSGFARHLNDDGVVMVEPWFEPAVFVAERFSIDTASTSEIAISRMSHTSVEGSISRIRFEYLIGSASGIRHVAETHELGLFTKDEMLHAFEQAGLIAEHDPQGIFGRGLYVARKASHSEGAVRSAT
jgi:SAM-dependent methyltransferase